MTCRCCYDAKSSDQFQEHKDQDVVLSISIHDISTMSPASYHTATVGQAGYLSHSSSGMCVSKISICTYIPLLTYLPGHLKYVPFAMWSGTIIWLRSCANVKKNKEEVEKMETQEHDVPTAGC